MSTSADHGRPDPATTTPALGRDGRPVYDRGDTVCVIGAGASGLTAIKNLSEHGFGVDCYERETGVGGAWNWRHDRSPVYASTHLISSKPFTQFPDFPMPDSWPDYPHHSQVLAYLERYADHFDLRAAHLVRHRGGPGRAGRGRPLGRDHPQHRRRRRRSAPSATRRWWSPTATTGRRSCPRTRAWRTSSGEVIHASAYKDAGPAARASGCSSSAPATPAATSPSRPPSRRRAAGTRPAAATGTRRSTSSAARPTRSTTRVLALRLPLRAAAVAVPPHAAATVGDLTRFGLPEPDHKVYETHPIANSQLVYYLGHGAITPVPDVARFHPRRGRAHRRPGGRPGPGRPRHRLPAALRVPRPGAARCRRRTGRPRLYLHAFPPAIPTLAVAGLLQPDSGMFTLVHWQTVRYRPAGCGCGSRAGPGGGVLARRSRRRRRAVQPARSRTVDPALVRGQPRRLPAGRRRRALRRAGGGA